MSSQGGTQLDRKAAGIQNATVVERAGSRSVVEELIRVGAQVEHV